MKRIFTILMLATGVYAGAQNSYDAMRLVDTDIRGTARVVGMGGAMSALGTDISVIGTNPAGIGLYRSNDFAFSLSMNNNVTESNLTGSKTTCDKNSFSIDNVGMVLSTKVNEESLEFINMGFNYSRRNNFNAKKEIAGSLTNSRGDYFSQQYGLRELYCNGGDYADYIDYKDYTSFNYPWLGLLTSTSKLVDDNGELKYLPGVNKDYPSRMNYYSSEKGGVDEFDFNVSANISDRLYLGITLSTMSVDYSRYSEYTEYCDKYDYYTIKNRYNTAGEGFNVKLGAIVRPLEYSSLRLGVSLHTPTWYSLTDCSSATMIGADGEVWDTRDWDAYGEDLYVDYSLITPWRFNLSAAYTFGKSVAVDAEYEFVDYSSAKLEYADGGDMRDLNNEIESNMQGQHIFRVGALYNVSDAFSLRCGYNYMTAPFKNSAAKTCLMYTDTSTEYCNRLESNILTAGLGFAGKSVYFDVAYKYAMQNAQFYSYYDSLVDAPADITEKRHNVTATLGFRF